jgi:hypothetical protein
VCTRELDGSVTGVLPLELPDCHAHIWRADHSQIEQIQNILPVLTTHEICISFDIHVKPGHVIGATYTLPLVCVRDPLLHRPIH